MWSCELGCCASLWINCQNPLGKSLRHSLQKVIWWQRRLCSQQWTWQMLHPHLWPQVIILRRASWLQNSSISPVVQQSTENLPFHGRFLFSEKTDETLHYFKGSHAILQSLGVYTQATNTSLWKSATTPAISFSSQDSRKWYIHKGWGMPLKSLKFQGL